MTKRAGSLTLWTWRCWSPSRLHCWYRSCWWSTRTDEWRSHSQTIRCSRKTRRFCIYNCTLSACISWSKLLSLPFAMSGQKTDPQNYLTTRGVGFEDRLSVRLAFYCLQPNTKLHYDLICYSSSSAEIGLLSRNDRSSKTLCAFQDLICFWTSFSIEFRQTSPQIILHSGLKSSKLCSSACSPSCSQSWSTSWTGFHVPCLFANKARDHRTLNPKSKRWSLMAKLTKAL